MSKRKKSKGHKRKGRLAEAFKKLDRGSKPPGPFEEGHDARCQECRCGWRAGEKTPTSCPVCNSPRVQVKDAQFRCMNCGGEYMDFPGIPWPETSEARGWKHCPNPGCRSVSGPDHSCSPEERGRYVRWVNYEEWAGKHGRS